MKNKIIVCLLLLLQAYCSTATDIIHTDSLDTLMQHIEQPTDLIVFDLDETIFTLEHGEHWLAALCAEKKISHFDKVKDFYIWHAMQDEHHLLESHTPQIIAELQRQGYKVIALTARNTPKFVQHTAQLLVKLGIDFSRSGLASADIQLTGLPHPAFYHKGIVSCGNNEKGVVLGRLIDTLKLSPTKIIFVDDKLHHVESVKLHMGAKRIPFVGIRYGRTDGTSKVLSHADHINYHAWFDGLPGMFATS